MKPARFLLAVFVAAAFLSAPLRAEPAHASAASPQQQFAMAVAKFAALLQPLPDSRQTLTTRLEMIKGEGLPKELARAQVELALAAPDRLRIGATIGKEQFEMGRDRQELWVWRAKKNFGVVGAPGLLKYSAAPESRDTTTLEPISLPLPAEQLALLPLLCTVEPLPDASIHGVRCRVLRATPMPQLRDALKIGEMTLTLWLREGDGLPVQIGYQDGKSVDALLALHELRPDATLPETHWQIPAPADAAIQRVALSHLANFFPAAIRTLSTNIKPLGPVTGAKEVVASHGRGRLERHDGTSVLFLKGSPEEMGEQHGTLLQRQVRDLVSRVLYGVGVGSSFEKGRWFFGEIEECQARIAPFIVAPYLREMDALARAAGLDAQEIRLANFFPELFHCSGFALMGSATQGGRIFHGRVLDYMKGVGLEGNATVIVHQPDDGHAWVNVSYAGFVGTVTAMNDAHISIGEMGGRGEGNWDGKPMAQLLREVMEKAGTLDEALAILQRGPRTCEYYYVIADGKTGTAAGVKATPELFEVVRPGEAHPQLPTAIKDAVLLSAGERYTELARRVEAGFGAFDAESARALMTRPVCMSSNIHSVLFAPDTLDLWVANADGKNVASHARYTRYNLRELLQPVPAPEGQR